MLIRWVLCFFFFGALSAGETSRTLQFENDQVKVWRTMVMPNQPLKLHRHDCDRVVVGLSGGALTKVEEDGSTSPLIFDAGKAYFLERDPPDTLHGDINESDQPVVVMVIELR